MVKGIGYILEAILSMFILLAFSVGALQVTGGEQNWEDFQAEIVSEDLSYSLSQTGDFQEFMARGDSGAFQTSVESITEQNYQVSSSIEGLPSFNLRVSVLVLDNENEDITEFDELSEDLECAENELDPAFDLSEELYVNTDRFSEELYLGTSNEGNSRIFLNEGANCELSLESIHEETDIFVQDDSDFYLDELSTGSQELSIFDVSIYEEIRSVIESNENSINIEPEFSYFVTENEVESDDFLLTKRDSVTSDMMVRFNTDSPNEAYINPDEDRDISRFKSLLADYSANIMEAESSSLGDRSIEINVTNSDNENIRAISASVLWVSIEEQNIENEQFTRTNLNREINTEIIGSLDSDEILIPYVVYTRWGY